MNYSVGKWLEVCLRLSLGRGNETGEWGVCQTGLWRRNRRTTIRDVEQSGGGGWPAYPERWRCTPAYFRRKPFLSLNKIMVERRRLTVEFTLDVEQYDCPYIATSDDHDVAFSTLTWEFDRSTFPTNEPSRPRASESLTEGAWLRQLGETAPKSRLPVRRPETEASGFPPPRVELLRPRVRPRGGRRP